MRVQRHTIAVLRVTAKPRALPDAPVLNSVQLSAVTPNPNHARLAACWHSLCLLRRHIDAQKSYDIINLFRTATVAGQAKAQPCLAMAARIHRNIVLLGAIVRRLAIPLQSPCFTPVRRWYIHCESQAHVRKARDGYAPTIVSRGAPPCGAPWKIYFMRRQYP